MNRKKKLSPVRRPAFSGSAPYTFIRHGKKRMLLSGLFEINERYNTIAVYGVLVILFTMLFLFVCLYFDTLMGGIGFLLGILKPLIYGFVFAFMFNPILKWVEALFCRLIEKKRSHPTLCRMLSLTVTYLLIISIIVLFLLFVIPQVINSYTDLQAKLSGYISAVELWINDTFSMIPAIDILFKTPSPSGIAEAQYLVNENGSIPALYSVRISDMQSNEMLHLIRQAQKSVAKFDIADILNDGLRNFYGFLMDITPYILSSVSMILTETKNIVLALIISVYYLATKEKLFKSAKLSAAAFMPEKTRSTCYKLIALVNRCFIGYINGKVLDAAIIGVLCFILMSILRMPYAPLVSLMVGVTNVIPYVGPFLGAVPGAFIILVSNPPMVIWFVLLIIGLQQLDSIVIEPSILRGQLHLDSVWIITSVTVMSGLLGILGLFIGVPVFSVLYVLIKEFVEARLIKKRMPHRTEDYMNMPTAGIKPEVNE